MDGRKSANSIWKNPFAVGPAIMTISDPPGNWEI